MVRFRHVTLAMCAACGGGAGQGASAPHGPKKIALEPVVSAQWYRSPTPCGQGPYELDVPVSGGRWGEEVELRLATPRRIALHAEIVADDQTVIREQGVYDRTGRVGGAADNARCVADARERLAASRGGGGTSGGGSTGGGGSTSVVDAPPPTRAPVTLVAEPGLEPTSQQVVRYAWTASHRVRIRLWSIEPNDLADVRIGVAHIAWQPNVSEAEYDAYQARLEAERADEARRADEAERTREAHVTVVVETDAQRAERERAERERWRLERERAERERLRVIEEERQRTIAAALEAQRIARREAFCASHGEDRDCWGAGGRRVHDELARHDQERVQYCEAAPEDARCWTDDTWDKRRGAFQKRVQIALAPPKEPEGPPPAPQAEEMPPKLSEHAEWRPGYWQWTGTDWAWLGGMWRVPESDIVAELTTTAPAAPPPLRVETVPASPMRVLIWVPGFWQWGGSAWVWVAGSYQRPEAGTTWRPAEWRPHGKVHVLIPGQWVRK